MVYDGGGGEPRRADVAVRGDRIAEFGDVRPDRGRRVIDAEGKAVTPGFINVLSWACDCLLVDGRAQSDVRQGVTTEVFGEGSSMGPLNPEMRRLMLESRGDLRFDVPWQSLGEYLEHLEARGVSVNVASFVGATTLREYVVGFEDRLAKDGEIRAMRELAAEAMKEGALGVGSSLIYAPASYAGTDELIALAGTAADYGGMYISHIRSEGERFEEAFDEFIAIARASGAPAEIYHLKAAGRRNWHKMDRIIEKIEAARADGVHITADMYSYPAAATGLDAMMPPWVQEGGFECWVNRLKDKGLRGRLIREMSAPGEWENLYLAAGGAEHVSLIGFRKLKSLTGMTLAEAAKHRGQCPEEAAIELVIEDGSRVNAAYALMSEENIIKKIRRPWVSFGSDSGALTIGEPFTLSGAHPRAYGNFARVYAEYVRRRGVLTIQEAVRKMTSLPAENLKLKDRGRIEEGWFADIAVFDPDTVQDHSTFARPHRYSTGVSHVLVNGVPVIEDGEHTGAYPGAALRGPGWRGRTIA